MNFGRTGTSSGMFDRADTNMNFAPASQQNYGRQMTNNSQNPIQELLNFLGNKFQCLQQFFFDYDSYEARVFDQWELQMMFPSVRNIKVFEELHRSNNKDEPLKEGQMSLKYLVQQMESVGRFTMKFELNKSSIYVDKILRMMQDSAQADNQWLYQKLMEITKSLGNYPHLTFDQIFPNAPCVDHRILQNSSLASKMNDHQLNLLFDFFKPASNEPSFNKINFCAALKWFREISENPTGFQQRNQNNMMNQMGQMMPSMGQNAGGMMPGMGQTMPGMGYNAGGMMPQMGYNAGGMMPAAGGMMPQMGYNAGGMMPQMGYNPGGTMPGAGGMMPGMGFNPLATMPGAGGMMPGMGYQGQNNQVPNVNQDEQIARDPQKKTLLLKLSKHIEKLQPNYDLMKMFQSCNKQNLAGNILIPEQEFEQVVMQELTIQYDQAKKLSQLGFQLFQNVPFVNLTTLDQARIHSDHHSDGIISSFQMDLKVIYDALLVQFKSPFEFFKPFQTSNGLITKPDYLQAIQSLQQTNGGRINTADQMWNRLTGESQQLSIVEICHIMKRLSMRLNDFQKNSQSLLKALDACNNDVEKVIDGVTKFSRENGGLSLRIWTTWWMGFKDSQKFLNSRMMAEIGEHFIKEEDGTLDLEQIKFELRKILKDQRLMQKMDGKSILSERLQTVNLQMTATNSYLSATCNTMTYAEGSNVMKPMGFEPRASQDNLAQILMSLNIKQDTALEFFRACLNGRGAELGQSDFENACTSSTTGLDIKEMTQMEFKEIFDDVDRNCHSGKLVGRITPDQIDQYLFFSLKTTVSRIHEDMLQALEQIYHNSNIDIHSEFDARSQGRLAELDKQEFLKIALRNVKWSTLRKSFLAAQYSRIGGVGLVQFTKFQDDIRQETKKRTDRDGFMSKAAYTEVEFAEKLQKEEITSGKTLAGVLGSAGNDRFLVNQNNFFKAFQILDFGHEWDKSRNAFWQIIDKQDNGQVEYGFIKAWVSKNTTKKPDRLYQDLLSKTIIQQGEEKKLQSVFDNELIYTNSRAGIMMTSDFSKILSVNWRLPQLDADFMGAMECQRQGLSQGQVDANNFIQHCRSQSRTVSTGQTEDEVKNKMYLKKFVQVVKSAGLEIQLAKKFDDAAKNSGMKNGLLSMAGFKEIIQNICPSTFDELQSLEKQYQSREDRNLISYKTFLFDVNNQITNGVRAVLTQEMKSVALMIFNSIKEHGKEHDLWKDLERLDRDRTGYLTENQISDVVLRYLPVQKGHQADVKIKIVSLIKNCEQNVNENYQIKHFMELLMGNEVAQAVMNDTYGKRNVSSTDHTINSTGAKVKTGNSVSFGYADSDNKQNQNFSSVVAVSDARLSSLGEDLRKRMKVSQYEQLLIEEGKRQSKAGTMPQVTVQDVVSLMRNIDVQPNSAQVDALNELFTKKGKENKMDLDKYLLEIGVESKELKEMRSREPVKVVKILDEDQKKACQEFIIQVRKHATNKKVDFNKLKSEFSLSGRDLISPADFVKGLSSICKDNIELSNIVKTQRTGVITWLIWYLSRVEIGQVCITKLQEAWQQRIDETPLKQDGVEKAVKYQNELRAQLKNFEQIKLFSFMRNEGKVDFQEFFGIRVESVNAPIHENELKTKLEKQGYPTDSTRMQNLFQELRSTDVTKPQISVRILYDSWLEFKEQKKQGGQKRLPPQIQRVFDEINKHLKQNNLNVKQLFKDFDTSGDGNVDLKEFLAGCNKWFNIPGLDQSSFRDIYNFMDLNKDQNVSLNEFGMYLETCIQNVEQAIKNVHASTKDEVRKQVQELFRQIDQNGDGSLTPYELSIALKKYLGQDVTEKDALEMIRQVDLDGNDLMDAKEFEEFMMPKMLEQIVCADMSDEKFRAMFKKYDTDYSNYLTVDELLTVLVKEIGVDMTPNELIDMLAEFDQDGNGKIDIDEFVSLMSQSNLNFQDEKNQLAFDKIQTSRKFQEKDMLQMLFALPKSFVDSFFIDRWTKFGLNTPSSVFQIQIDPKTMNWKDLHRPAQGQTGDKPKLRPVQVSLGGQITIESSEGIPNPKGLDPNTQKIVKRVLRVGIYDPARKNFVENTCQVTAELASDSSDTWNFDKLNPLIFRTSKEDQNKYSQLSIIIELVIYISQDLTNTVVKEMSCGWAEISQDFFSRTSTNIKLNIMGGTPFKAIQHDQNDLNIKREGIKKFVQMLTPGVVKSVLVVSIKPYSNMPQDETIHIECLPQTCIIQKKLLWFLSGYRNYAAELLHSKNTGRLQAPCDVVISCLPKILDSPDIVEVLSQVWYEDVQKGSTADNRKNISQNQIKAQKMIQKLYPVIFSDVFEWTEDTRFKAIAPGDKKKARDNLLKACLRYGVTGIKEIAKQPIEDLTTFRPFNIRELEVSTFDEKKTKKENQLNDLVARGKINMF